MAKKKGQGNIDLANVLFPSLDQQEAAESILSIPPLQRKLHTEAYDFTVSTLLDYFDKGNIYVPEYQRRYVWTNTQASRLIESLIIQCPIPVIYLSQDPDERLAVIDGNQRVQSLSRFIKGAFKLEGLTAYPELDGLLYSELDSRFQRHIQNRTLRCLSILKDTHPQVKFDVFERLNTGSVRLSPQELRHGMYHGALMKAADELAGDKVFASLVDIRHNKRMKLEELVLRFLAFNEGLRGYRKPLSDFINRFCEHNQKAPQAELDRLSKLFRSTIAIVERIYGTQAFKIIDSDGSVLSPFNAALYDAEMHVASQFVTNKRTPPSKAAVQAKTIELMQSNDEFRKAVVQATSDDAQVKARMSILYKALSAL